MKVKFPKLFKSDTFLPMSAVVVFAALIAILMIVKRTTGRTYIGYSSPIAGRMTHAQRLAYINSFRVTRPVRPTIPTRPVRPIRTVPSRALIGMGLWNRRWDQMSGSSRYSRDMMRGSGGRGRGRGMGRPMLHMA